MLTVLIITVGIASLPTDTLIRNLATYLYQLNNRLGGETTPVFFSLAPVTQFIQVCVRLAQGYITFRLLIIQPNDMLILVSVMSSIFANYAVNYRLNKPSLQGASICFLIGMYAGLSWGALLLTLVGFIVFALGTQSIRVGITVGTLTAFLLVLIMPALPANFLLINLAIITSYVGLHWQTLVYYVESGKPALDNQVTAWLQRHQPR